MEESNRNNYPQSASASIGNVANQKYFAANPKLNSTLPPCSPFVREENKDLTSPTKKTENSSKKSSHSTHEQLRYEAGITGVYINPRLKGSAEPTRGRPIKRPRLVVFRSEKLKDVTWLEKRRGTWHDYVAAAIASQIIDAENNTPAPQKRKIGDKRILSNETSDVDSKKRKASTTSKSSAASLENNSISPTRDLSDRHSQGDAEITSSLEKSKNNSVDSPELNQSVNIFPSNFQSTSESIKSPQNTQQSHQMSSLRKQQATQDKKQDLYHHHVYENNMSQSSKSRDIAPLGINGEESGLDSFFSCAPSTSGTVIEQPQFQPSYNYAQTNQTSMPSLQQNPSQHIASYRLSYHTSEDKNALNSSNNNNNNNQEISLNRRSQRRSLNQVKNHSPQDYIIQNEMIQDTIENQNENHSSAPVIVPAGADMLRLRTEACAQSFSSPFDKSTRATNDTMNLGTSQNISSMHNHNNSMSIAQLGSKRSNFDFINHSNTSSNPQSEISRFHIYGNSMNSSRNTPFQEPESSPGRFGNEAPSQMNYSSANIYGHQSAKRSQSQMKHQEQLNNEENNPKKSKLDPTRRTCNSEPAGCGEPDLDKAAAIYFPPELDRLTCRYQGKAGNLLLSANKQLLEFHPADQHRLENAILRLAVSRIPQNPITSVIGSKPMELRIKEMNQANTVTLHVFEILPTASASEAANNMRAKIVTGIVACKFRSGEDYNHPVQIKEKIQKPYQCSTCDKRFKNQNGLEYHVSKAATTCNPNFDPQVGPGKRGRKKRKSSLELSKEGSQIAQNTSSPLNNRLNEIEPGNENPDSTNDSGSSSSSDDSIIRWAMQNATSGLERPRKDRVTESFPRSVTTNQKSYKSLPREATVLSEIVEESATINSEVTLSFPQIEFANVIPNVADQVPFPGTLDMARYESLLLSLVKANNDIFPGDKSLWFACVGVWLKKNVENMSSLCGANAPESKVCIQLIDKMVESKKLKRHNFYFEDKVGRSATRYLVSTSGTNLNTSRVKEIQCLMVEVYPDYYVPPQFSPPGTVLSKLHRLTTRSIKTLASRGNYEEDSCSSSEESILPSDPDGSSLDRDDDFIDNNNRIDSKNKIDNKCSESSNLQTTKNLVNETRTKNRGLNVSQRLRRCHSGRTPQTRSAVKKLKFQKECVDGQALDPMTCQPKLSSTTLLTNFEKGASDHAPVEFLTESITSLQGEGDTLSSQSLSCGVTSFPLSPMRINRKDLRCLSHSKEIDDSPILSSTNFACPNRMSSNNSNAKILETPKLKPVDKGPKTNPNTGHRTRTSARISSKLQICKNNDNAVFKPNLPETASVSDRTKRYMKRGQTDSQIKIDFQKGPSDLPKEISQPQETREVSVKTPTQPTADLSEIEIVSLFEPKKLGAGAAQNPGLETLPSSFSLVNFVRKSPIQRNLEDLVNHSRFDILMPNIIDSECNFERGSWTLAEFSPCKSDNYNLRQDDRTSFGLDTLPYRDLCFALSIDENVPVTNYVEIQKRAKIAHHKPNNNSKRMKFTRLLTHLNVDFWGIGGRPEASASFLSIPMAAGDDIAKLRKRNAHDSMSFTIEKRFIIAVIVIRTLTGGIECLTDWVLVSLLFPRFSLNFIRGHWKQLLIRHKKAIDRLEIDFQDAFVPAYESGEIERIDYDNLQEYNWNKLIDWTINTVDTSFSHKPVSIPSSRTELKCRYSLEIIDPKDSWRDKWFESNAAIYRRLDYACFNALSVSTKDQKKIDVPKESTNLTVAKSWIRAIALSPDDECPLEAADKFGRKVSEQALAELIETKVIIHRSKKRVNLSSRDYEATEMFSRPLRREVKPKCFRDASVFKRYLDSEFRSGKKCVRVDYLAWEGDVMVISNLQAHNRIKLTAIGVPREKFGLTEGGYETKKIPRERLRFDMDIYPTSTYIYEDENPVILKALSDGPPRGDQRAIPVWFKVSEVVNGTLWKEVYSAVAQVMALRAGIDIQELLRIFAPTMEEWEIRLLINWGERLGLFHRLHKDINGWIAGEWWWAYAMALFAEDRFTVGQDVRFEPKNPFTIDGRRAG